MKAAVPARVPANAATPTQEGKQGLVLSPAVFEGTSQHKKTSKDEKRETAHLSSIARMHVKLLKINCCIRNCCAPAAEKMKGSVGNCLKTSKRHRCVERHATRRSKKNRHVLLQLSYPRRQLGKEKGRFLRAQERHTCLRPGPIQA
eukprot:1161809-Pelagomonas_calceolata.AAC.1